MAAGEIKPKVKHRRRTVKGEPWVWLSGGAVAVGIMMIIGMVTLITVEGTTAFWPHNLDAYVLGEARFHVQHPEHGQVWVSRDDTMLVIPGAEQAFRLLDGGEAPADIGRPQRLTTDLFEQRPGLAEVAADRPWRLRDRNNRMLRDSRGLQLTLETFLADPESRRPRHEDGRDGWMARVFLEDAVRGPVYITEDDVMVIPVAWRMLDGRAVEFDFDQPRLAAIEDFREFRDLFEGDAWLLAQPNGAVVRDAEGEPVTAQRYLDSPAEFPSPWGYLDADGKHVPLEQILGDDRWRDYRVLVGAPRGSPRDMDIRELPPNPDGTPVRPYQLEVTPREYLIRQGNQGQTLYNEAAYFRWVRKYVPDVQALRRHRTSTYSDTVLAQVSLPHAALLERLEGGVLTGYVTRVTLDEEVVADLERDGREAVWEAFVREQRRMRRQYLQRYDIENRDIGYVNHQLKRRSDGLKRVRYVNRDSRNVVTMVERINQVHDRWQAVEPMPEADTTEAEWQTMMDEWLATLDELLDEWRAGVQEFLDADQAALEQGRSLIGAELSEREARAALRRLEDDRAALVEVERLQRERAAIQVNDFAPLRYKTTQMRVEERTSTFDFATPDGRTATIPLSHVVRGFRPNEYGLWGKLGVYGQRIKEFLTDDPRESNTEGGIWPVIIGTLVMVLLMCVAVVPFGVIAALYLREYAKQGPVVSTVRIAVNNLAGVPSIVFGIFGLGFFCWIMGGTIDDLFFPELKPTPVFGGGGVMWAALTLALLTVPVVIVATEEALSAVPSSQREASLACGASKFQTVWKVVLPQALPGVLTGTILAMARGAGEVAPLMLVGAVKYAPYPPVDGIPPFVHLERKFMHLGFHVFDVGFQSPNVDNTKPLVFATALTLLLLIAALNLFAIALRNRLRRKYATSAV
jgi:phosphate ABC transporter permease subunit PstA